MFLLVLCVLTYILLKIKLLIDYHYAHVFYQSQQSKICQNNISLNRNKTKQILFWTKIFSSPIDSQYLNNYLFTSTGRCSIHQCKVSNNRKELCDSDAVVFHARGGIKMYDMPKARLPYQRYVLLTKEPPYKTTAIVGHLNYFFNWTATYRTDSDIDYRYFRWRRKDNVNTEIKQQSYLKNRQVRAASMISNCYSQNNRENYLKRLSSIIPVTRIGFCSWNKCRKRRDECLNELANTHPFFLAFENSLCRDYATEKYANVIINRRMIPVVFSKTSNLYIPNSFIDANQFSSPEDLGQFLINIVNNSTLYDSYFKWINEYELVIPDENDYLCELCKKLHNPIEPYKVYDSMKKWLYDDAKCQRWISRLNKTIDIPVDETMDYEDPLF
ncbi:unnamed protein product [Rotaria sp. Silwood2]|nr:unnamed protein product [Rotaria sp. Silwood2]CAF3348534.1 unnamed protein product [Rotaria sp. Silwood2]CAF3441402.1 unnamed protein product [Rotaria sp. Silwood2]CAF4465069.1 unnamed protein product [Rotaria sp. Silwood2]CAF4503343.1 unnamed protein product [Rotaria sp. Silwood2]